MHLEGLIRRPRTAPKKSEVRDDEEIKTQHMIGNRATGKLETVDGTCTALSMVGGSLKDHNEDAVFVDSDFIAVADGMGGARDGSLAAYWTLVGTIKGRHRGQPVSSLPGEACNTLMEQNLSQGSGATLAMAKKTPLKNAQTKLELCSVGDAKVYVISKSQKEVIYESNDQSLIQSQIDSGVTKDPLERYSSPVSNIVLSAVMAEGLGDEPRYKELVRPVGDTIIVCCSDGVSDFMTPEEVTEIALKYQNLAADKIAETALSRQNRQEGFDVRYGGKKHHIQSNHGDNTSVAVMMA